MEERESLLVALPYSSQLEIKRLNPTPSPKESNLLLPSAPSKKTKKEEDLRGPRSGAGNLWRGGQGPVKGQIKSEWKKNLWLSFLNSWLLGRANAFKKKKKAET